MNCEEFAEKYNRIVERALCCADKARREGLLAVEELIDEEKFNKRELFEVGLQLVVDGIDGHTIDRILSNIISLETDNDEKILKNIQKEAVLGIQSGEPPRLLSLLLNSHVNIGIEEAMKRYTKL
jgi:flagellar motor component MotA